jgi:hypothetical protein
MLGSTANASAAGNGACDGRAAWATKTGSMGTRKVFGRTTSARCMRGSDAGSGTPPVRSAADLTTRAASRSSECTTHWREASRAAQLY